MPGLGAPTRVFADPAPAAAQTTQLAARQLRQVLLWPLRQVPTPAPSGASHRTPWQVLRALGDAPPWRELVDEFTGDKTSCHERHSNEFLPCAQRFLCGDGRAERDAAGRVAFSPDRVLLQPTMGCPAFDEPRAEPPRLHPRRRHLALCRRPPADFEQRYRCDVASVRRQANTVVTPPRFDRTRADRLSVRMKLKALVGVWRRHFDRSATKEQSV